MRTLEAKRLEPDFWNDADAARQTEKQVSEEKSWVVMFDELYRKLEDVETLTELVAEDPDPELQAEVAVEEKNLLVLLENAEIRSMLTEPDDHRNAILNINSGAGGTESQDWSEMLMRMYIRWGESKGYVVNTLEYQEGEVAGIKSCTLRFEGPSAFGYLKAESGVHRLVRISPFDSNARRHTSFASVFVFPEVDDTIEISLNADDIEMQVFRSGGKGGQNVNKVSSGVRLIWTGKLSDGRAERVVAECTEERSQLQNREKCMMMLKSRIYLLEREIQDAARSHLEKGKKKIEWGSQIRSYVFQPYTMVNDHRIELKSTNIQAVMDGDLDPFIKGYLMATALSD
ncbi:MAG TPA: peptide chain release factor 2 [Bacteroidetes bacterium]|nr:peptide chain release factor 2 [Bacteroidota bacterium]